MAWCHIGRVGSIQPLRATAGAGMPGMPGMPGQQGQEGGVGPGMPDNENYMQAMGGVLQNPQFMEMAEKLGQQIMTVSV